MTGEIFYRALFEPGKVAEAIDEKLKSTVGGNTKELDITTEDLAALTRPVKDPIFLTGAFDKKEFVEKYCHAMTNEVRFQETYFEGAEEEVAKMLEHGPVRIWTTGDVYGIPSLELSGHGEQIKRVARGFHAFRRDLINKEVETARAARHLSRDEEKELRRSLKSGGDFGYVAHEDKVKALKQVADDFSQKGVKTG